MRRVVMCAWMLAGATACAAPVATPVQATGQRPSFTTNTSITHPGTVELEMGVQVSGVAQLQPDVVKFTPGAGPLAGRVEFAVGFDAVAHDEGAPAHFGDAVTLYGRIPLAERGAASVAVAPFVAVPTRPSAGPGQVGGTFITTWTRGVYSADVNVTAAHATGSSDADARSGNVAFALSRTIGGPDGRLAVYTSGLADAGDHRAPRFSLLEGVTYEATPRVTIDVSLGHLGLGASTDLALVAGVTANVGAVRQWFGARRAP